MSLVKVSGNASGTGTLTIAAPNTNSDYTLTLPTNTGTLISTASTGQVIPKAALPTGSVLQVIYATYSTIVSATTTTFVDTGLSASITPSSSSSKILVIVDQNGCQKTNDIEMYLQLLRGSSSILYFATGFGSTNSAAKNNFGTASCTYLDSPATTSSTTYKTQLGSFGATSSVQTASAISTITLMEIAG